MEKRVNDFVGSNFVFLCSYFTAYMIMMYERIYRTPTGYPYAASTKNPNFRGPGRRAGAYSGADLLCGGGLELLVLSLFSSSCVECVYTPTAHTGVVGGKTGGYEKKDRRTCIVD